MQSLVAPLVSAAECNRPTGAAACSPVASGQACTGRLASSASAARNGSASGAPEAAQRSMGLVQRAHQRGLLVHAYTFRNEVCNHSTLPVTWHVATLAAAFCTSWIGVNNMYLTRCVSALMQQSWQG